MKKAYFLKGTPYPVLNDYFTIVEKAFSSCGYDVIYLNNIKDVLRCDRKDIFFTTELKIFFLLYIYGCRTIVHWFQGITPEEDYLCQGSFIRKKIFEKLEYLALSKCKIAFVVSKSMQNHYEKKYKIDLSTKAFLMPCFNEEIHNDSFYNHDKYNINTFCYVGGLAKWQAFEKTLDYYSLLLKKTDQQLFLKIFTISVDKAKEIIASKGLTNVEVKYVKKENLNIELNSCKFGLILREDIAINNVATPTKLSTYLANGIIPIFSACIYDFDNLARNYKYLISLSDFDDYQSALPLIENNVDPNDINAEYNKIFNDYYNKEFYISKITSYISNKITNNWR